MSATTPHLRTKRTAKEVLPRLLAAHDPPISRNKLSRLLDISLGHVSRSCSRNHHERFSGEALARIAAVLDLPEDYFLETRSAYVARSVAEDPHLCEIAYDLLLSAAAVQADNKARASEADADGATVPHASEATHPLLMRTPFITVSDNTG